MQDSASPDERHMAPRLDSDDQALGIDIYSDEGYALLSRLWTRASWQRKISYRAAWLGIPIIQLPEDLLMMQELVWRLRPTVIIETGTAHGGTAVFYASLLELLGRGRVISIDVEIRAYNRVAIQAHPLSHRITLVEESSTAPQTLAAVERMITPQDVVLVCLDSNHTYQHVRAELDAYAPLVTPGSYLVVFDGVMELLAGVPGAAPDWERDNPLRAATDFLREHPEFEIDPYYNRLDVTYAPQGFLRRREGH